MNPTPQIARWQPLRTGLVDLFYYDIEEFHFHDGRLLLRGNNGTGKSKVLALTLPFLLDGELSPHRVEPDGDRNKRMEWNLLLGGKHPNNERLGYTWLEFGRLLPDGTPEYRTIGCGLKAVAGRGIARHWYFVTSQRIGEQLSLLSPTRVALTRERLKDAVDGHGTVYDTATDYRRAVDEALFSLGAHRYEALVNLLIQLRQPQLSKRPDEKLLSRALTEALPPLDPSLVTTVADAFRGLDEEREALRGLGEAKTAAEAFLTHYRRYARIAARRRSLPPRQAQSRYEALNTELTRADADFHTAEVALRAVEEALAGLTAERGRLAARQEALNDSPEMADAKRLDTARLEAENLERTAGRREDDRVDAANTVRVRKGKVERERQAAETDQRTLDTARATAEQRAERAMVAIAHADVMAEFARDEPPYADAGRAGDAVVDKQIRAVAELDRLLSLVFAADAELRRAREAVDRITGEQQRAVELIGEAEVRLADAGRRLVESCTAYLAGVTGFTLSDVDAVLGELEAWTDSLDGANPVTAAVDHAVSQATAELGRRQAETTARAKSVDAEIKAVTDEIDRLESGGHDAPPSPHTRAVNSRQGRPGAPLWRVVDFAPGVGGADRAGIEAALEAAGILDAWVTPDGRLLDDDDTTVVAQGAVASTALASVMIPAIDQADDRAATLTDAGITAVLRAIGLGPHGSTWVDVDGRYAIGVLSGSWHKDSAVYIGEGAREASRRARLAHLRTELDRLLLVRAELAESAAELVRMMDVLIAEHKALPGDEGLREAHTRLAGAHQVKRGIDENLASALVVVSEKAERAQAERERAEEFAGDVGLPADRDALHAVRVAVGDYRVGLAELWPAARAAHRAASAVVEAETELALAVERQLAAAEEATEARERAVAAAEHLAVLRESAGAGVERLFAELAAVKRALVGCETEAAALRAKEKQAADDRGKADGRRETLRENIGAVVDDRDRAVAELREFAATGLLATALPDLDVPDPRTEWAPTPAVVLARAINTALEGVDDADRPWELIQQRVSTEHKLLTDALSRHGHSVGLTVHSGVMLVDVRFQGRDQDIPTLVDALTAETDQRTNLLSAKEREILENHLVNEVAGTLQELITGAEDQVRAINADLEARPTSTGMRLRLQWRTAKGAPEGLDRVRDRLLRQTADAWGQEDRALVGAFLQEQINREHTTDDGGGWVDQLTRALDYRSWHEFAIQRYQDGQWRPAAGPASGGERVLAASVPLFAAASSFYSSAGNPHAPRLIALDEAFAGVDDDSRAKCLGLLASFDLDVVMTSEREWGCYPQVPGLAIAQLARRDGIDAVLVTPWRWDGRDRVEVKRPVPYVPSPDTGSVSGTLFE
ncbi:TIGR02680 family protein [Actinokineospora xionganensis]|uniref:TIGR02680 family protein n=1 Tax=Actinokineospora xionganensis TaxID=2684470 RepID=A0ABR7L6T9_9PSEU|nr:TIGR02680 family protein [Actinokineospora xionganensis]MBC6448086.1 TIGR02680 family protein [Actinokineospora xionganensis]